MGANHWQRLATNDKHLALVLFINIFFAYIDFTRKAVEECDRQKSLKAYSALQMLTIVLEVHWKRLMTNKRHENKCWDTSETTVPMDCSTNYYINHR